MYAIRSYYVFKRLSLVKIEAGKASIIDELRVELELNDLNNQLALLSDTKQMLQVKFNNLLNAETSASIEVPETLWQDELPIDRQAILESIYNSNHELKSMDYRLNSRITSYNVCYTKLLRGIQPFRRPRHHHRPPPVAVDRPLQHHW